MHPEFPPVITASLRTLFNSCHAKAFWSEIRGFTPKATSIHLTAGGAYAAALEAFRTSYWTPSGDDSEETRYDRAVALGFEALIRAYGPADPPPEEKKQFDRVVAAFIEYLFTYPPSTEHAIPSYSVVKPRVEFSFAFEIADLKHPVTGDPLLYAGRLDQLVEYSGGLFVFDDKTASGIGPQWRKQWDLRSQLTGYVVGARLEDIPIVGAVLRGMAILKESCKTAEVITHRPEWLCDRWKERLIWDVKRMLDCWHSGYWPTTGEESGACYQYGVCQYHVLCTSQQPEQYTSVYFDESRWDPIARERKKDDAAGTEG
jgi:hypothetical protein